MKSPREIAEEIVIKHSNAKAWKFWLWDTWQPILKDIEQALTAAAEREAILREASLQLIKAIRSHLRNEPVTPSSINCLAAIAHYRELCEE